MTQIRLYSTQTRKNRVGFVSCSRVGSNFVSPTQKQSLEATINKQLSMQKVGKRGIGTGRDDGYMILIHHGLIQ